MKICIHDISKTITARSFNIGQLIEDDELVKIKKKVILFFSNYLPKQIWTISKTITAMSLKLGQLIEDDEEINW